MFTAETSMVITVNPSSEATSAPLLRRSDAAGAVAAAARGAAGAGPGALTDATVGGAGGRSPSGCRRTGADRHGRRFDGSGSLPRPGAEDDGEDDGVGRERLVGMVNSSAAGRKTARR
ncbi:hypothetical protein GCM10010524_31490 [Streptomyces mexicanus]